MGELNESKAVAIIAEFVPEGLYNKLARVFLYREQG